MSVVEMESCMARLYVDAALRKLLRVDPAAALDGYELSDRERDAILALPPLQCERMARTLRLKRQRAVEMSYPRLTALQNATVERLMRRYFEHHALEAGRSEEDDALAFGRFLEASLRERPEEAVALDTVIHERARLQVHCAAQLGGDGPRLVAHAEVLRLASNPADGDPGPCVLIVLGRADSAPLEFESDDTTARLLSLCDGRRSAREIAGREVEDGFADDEDDVLAALDTLRESGLITQRPS